MGNKLTKIVKDSGLAIGFGVLGAAAALGGIYWAEGTPSDLGAQGYVTGAPGVSECPTSYRANQEDRANADLIYRAEEEALKSEYN